MKSTPEERILWKEKSRTRKVVNLLNRLDLMRENSQVSFQEIDEILRKHKHIVAGMINLRIQVIRSAN